jgi:dihydrofolate reductase
VGTPRFHEFLPGVLSRQGGRRRLLRSPRGLPWEKDVAVMGGPEIGRQFIEAGLIDEISIHLVPVLFGGGTRLFEHLGGEHIQLETVSVMETPAAIHLGFRVVE